MPMDNFQMALKEVREYFTDRKDPSSPNSANEFELIESTKTLRPCDVTALIHLSTQIKFPLRKSIEYAASSLYMDA